VTNPFAPRPALRFARLGDFRCESGAVISDAFLGYRTAGELNSSRSNAVLLAPWFQGNSRKLARQVGPGRLLDPSKYFAIMVDTFGNGVSASPSNSTHRRRDNFPQFTIRDIVVSQYQFVTKALRLSRLHAVVGISMGGMQAFEWSVTYPDFMSKVISIVGSPQSQADDRERANEQIAWLRQARGTRLWRMLSRGKPRSALQELLLAPDDWIGQVEAIKALDIPRRFDGSLERTASAIRAQLMVVGTMADREVNARPGFELARFANAEILELDGRCGHQAPACEEERLWAAVRTFLDR
jgi:homoserine O-acetyltransferase